MVGDQRNVNTSQKMRHGTLFRSFHSKILAVTQRVGEHVKATKRASQQATASLPVQRKQSQTNHLIII
eukprot:m.9999 g.9999  ORF g.9999 m.9999 type:complete len:68 (+) comp8053_c0_seq1:103-306(+)